MAQTKFTMSPPLPPVLVYKVKKWKRISNLFWILCCFSVGSYLLYRLATNADRLDTWLQLLLVAFVLLIGFVGVYLFIELTSKLFIHPREMQFKTIRSNRTISFSDIAGYRIFDSGDSNDIGDTICIESKNKKQLILPVQLTDKEVLIEWLKTNFTDLSAAEYIEDKKQLLLDPTLGESVNDREENLKRAKSVVIWLTIIAIICPITLQFVNPYNSLAFVSIAIVPVTFIFVFRFKGIIHYSYHPTSAHPSAFFVLFLSSFLLSMYALFNFNFLEHTKLWIPVVVLGIIFWIILIVTTKEFSKRSSNDIATASLLFILLILYSWSTYRITNCVLDIEPGQTVTSEVVSKRISEGDGSDNYYISIKPIAPLDDLEISVEKEAYFKLEKGASVNIIVKKGKWGTPWYYADIK